MKELNESREGDSKSNIRPKYPSVQFWFGYLILNIVTAGTKSLLLTLLLYPAYQSFLSFLRYTLHFNDHETLTIVLLSSHTVAYFIINGMFTLFEYFKMFEKYKLPRQPYMEVSGWLKIRTLAQAFFGQFVITPLAVYYVLKWLITKRGLVINLAAPLPSYQTMFFTFCFAYEFNEWAFYFAHRAFHIPFLYQLFHKQHHEYMGTISIAAEFASPAEQIFANVLPTIGGILLARTHPLCICVWLIIRLQQTYEVHSGYCFKDTFLDRIGLLHAQWASHHDYHHSKNSGNFGSFTCDWLFGTMDSFIANNRLYIAQ